MSKRTIFFIMFIASIVWAVIERVFNGDSIFDQVSISIFCFIGVVFSADKDTEIEISYDGSPE